MLNDKGPVFIYGLGSGGRAGGGRGEGGRGGGGWKKIGVGFLGVHMVFRDTKGRISHC